MSLPDPDREPEAYLADLRDRLRAELARFLQAEAWLANRRAHFRETAQDEVHAHHESETDPASHHARSERDKTARRVQVLSAAIVAEVAQVEGGHHGP